MAAGAWQGGGMRGTGVCIAGVCLCRRHGRGRVWRGGVCMVRGMHGGGHVWRCGWGGAGCVGGQGVCVCGRGVCVAGETATASDGTHPTGMHSCFLSVLSPPSGKDGRHMISWLSIPGFPFLPPANEVSGR